jgi:hypothetical protein
MLRSFLLLLCWTSFESLSAQDRASEWLPRSGQFVDVWNGDLTQKLERTRIQVLVDLPLQTLEAENIPTLHYMVDEQRFSVPGVAATGKAQVVDAPGLIRYVYQGSQVAGTMEKEAWLELVRLDHGSCQLSWKLSVMNRGERVRRQEGALTYTCHDEPKAKMHRREAMHLLPENDLTKR